MTVVAEPAPMAAVQLSCRSSSWYHLVWLWHRKQLVVYIVDSYDNAVQQILWKAYSPDHWARAPHKVEVHSLQQAQVHDVVVVEGHLGQTQQPSALLLQPLA